MRPAFAGSTTIPVSTGAWLAAIDAHAREDYPDEACGLVTARIGDHGGADVTSHRCRNLQGLRHAADPVRFPETARTAYDLDPGDHRQVHRQADATGARIVAIYHSHADSGADFSARDHRQAAPLGEPRWPGVGYLVVSVRGGQVGGCRLYTWDAVRRAYTEADLALWVTGREVRLRLARLGGVAGLG